MAPNILPNYLRAWTLAARPKTLTAAAVPVMVGGALAFLDGKGDFALLPFLLCLLFALLMQVEANFINDYFDFLKGSDRADRLGPERACAQGWVTLSAMKRGILVTTLLSCAVGLPLVCYGGIALIAVGLGCVALAFLYTTRLSYLGYGDALVLLCFGIIPVGFTYYVELTTWTLPLTLTAVASGLAIDTLLMVNNYRDRAQDTVSGKRTLVVRYGARAGEWGYLLLGVAASALCLPLLCYGHHAAALLPLLYLLPHCRTWRKMVAIHEGKGLNLILGETARNILVFGVLLTAGILISAI